MAGNGQASLAVRLGAAFGILLLMSFALLTAQAPKEAYANEGGDRLGVAPSGRVAVQSGSATVTVKAGCSTADLQAALDRASDGTTLTVNIPAGKYSLTSTLYVHPNTTIKANAKAKLVKQARYGAILEAKLVKGKNGYKGTGYNGNHDITVDGGIWDSSPMMKDSQGTESFRFIHSNNITIKNATLCNVPVGSHLIVFAGVKNGLIQNCKFYGYYNYAKSTAYAREAIQLDNCHSITEVPTLQGDQIVWDGIGCDGVTITGCEIYNCPRALGSHTAVKGYPHKNVTISNNKIHDIAEAAMKLYNYQDTVVSGNAISNSSTGILVYTELADDKKSDDHLFDPPKGAPAGTVPTNYNVTITGNKISKPVKCSSLAGDGIRISGSTRFPMSNVKVVGNTIASPARYGIFASCVRKCTIGSKNTVSSAKADGILLNSGSNNSVVCGNKLNSSKGAGIAVYDSSSVSVYSNTVTTTGSDGILGYSSSKLKIGLDAKTGNVISGAKGNGIYLSTINKKTGCPNSSVLYNTVKSAAKDGVGLYLSKSTTVQGNKVTASGSGISASTNSTGCKIVGNTVNSAGTHGISLTSGCKAATVQKNTVKKYSAKGASGSGLYVWKSGGSSASKRTVVDGNTVSGSASGAKKDGVKVSESAFTTVSANKVSKSGGNGIYVYKSSKAVVRKNVVNSAKQGGVSLSTSPSSNVQGNTVTGAVKDGVSLYSCKSTKVQGNKVTASGSGISASTNSTGCKIVGNTVNSAGAHGISLTSGCKAATVQDNTVKKYSAKNSSSAGLYVWKSGGSSASKRTVVDGNTVSGSASGAKKDGVKVSESAFTTVSANKVSKSGGNGIYVYLSAGVDVTGNGISGAGVKGVAFSSSPDGKISKNSFEGVAKNNRVSVYNSKGTKQTK